MTSLAACLLAVSLGAGPVAHLRLATTDVKVRRGTETVPAAKDLPLSRTDVVDVPVGGVAFVEIDANGQVVRIDEDLQLAVSDLAALDAPRAQRSMQQQLELLLTPTERASRGTQRMVGWFVAPAGAEVPASSGLKKAAVEESSTAPDHQPMRDEEQGRSKELVRPKRAMADPSLGMSGTGTGGGGKTGGGVPKDNVVKTETVKTESVTDEVTTVTGRSFARPGPGGPPNPKPTQSPVTGSPSPPSPPPPPTTLPPTTLPPPTLPQPDEPTRACLRKAVAALGEKAAARLGDTLTVKVRRGGEGRAVVFLEGAVPVDACVQTWADRQLAGLPGSGWAQVEARLK